MYWLKDCFLTQIYWIIKNLSSVFRSETLVNLANESLETPEKETIPIEGL